MQSKININIVVDVIAALSDNTLHNHIYMMDDSEGNSLCKGTEYLTTVCQPGQMMQWNVVAIDLQTPVVIKNIVFNCSNNQEEIDYGYIEKSDCDAKVWCGVVPSRITYNNSYKYKLVIQMGEGKNSIMSINTASLIRG